MRNTRRTSLGFTSRDLTNLRRLIERWKADKELRRILRPEGLTRRVNAVKQYLKLAGVAIEPYDTEDDRKTAAAGPALRPFVEYNLAGRRTRRVGG